MGVVAATPAPTLVERAGAQVRQFLCGLHGHDALLHFQPGRMSLKCTSCPYESAGWDVTALPRLTEREGVSVCAPFPCIGRSAVATSERWE